MRRLIPIPIVACVLLVTLASCADGGGSALDTLPPIRTTSTLPPTTTVPPDLRRIFYEVQPGDNLSDIARSYGVPREEIVSLNNLPDGGQTIQIGQVIEIPNDMRLDRELPQTSSTTTATGP